MHSVFFIKNLFHTHSCFLNAQKISSRQEESQFLRRVGKIKH